MTDFEKYIISRWAYAVGKPIMSDAEWGILHEQMKAQYPDNPYLNRSWSSDPCPADLLLREGYRDLIEVVTLSDKTESIPSIESEYNVGLEYRGLNEKVSVSMKLDGYNVQLDVYDGKPVAFHTRGRATDNHLYLNDCIPRLPMEFPFKDKAKIVLEAIVADKDFQEVKRLYGNTSQRGAVRTLLAHKESLHLLSFRATDIISDTLELPPAYSILSYLEDLGFEVPIYYYADNYQEMMDGIKALSDSRRTYGLPTDGVVVRGLKTNAIRIGEWAPPILRSYVTGYKSDYAKHSISMGVTIRPIQLQNSVQREVTCTNLARIIRCNLRIGSPVAFKFTSEAIGVLDEEATRSLQKTYTNWETYRQEIDANEIFKERVNV